MPGGHVNRVELVAEIVASSGLRRTPGGIAAVELGLRHASTQTEAGQRRQVGCELSGQAFGAVAESLSRHAVAQPIRLTGFLDRRSVRDPRPVLHITEFESIQE
jgi:primosomal replication protein PriB